MFRLPTLSPLRKCLDDRSGGTMLLVAFALPAIVGGLALAVDASMWTAEKRRLRQVADVSSLGAARVMQAGATLQVARVAAANDAARNGFVPGPDRTITVNSPPTTGPNAGVAGAVEVIVTNKLPSSFIKTFFGVDKSIAVRAVAKLGSGGQNKNLEVALMLDVSQSMTASAGDGSGRSKLKLMQESAKSLVDTVVQTTQTPYKSRVALVPYSSSVNVGSTYYAAAVGSSSSAWSTVVERTGSHAFTDTPPASGRYFGKFSTKHGSALGAYNSTVRQYDSNVPGSGSRIRPLSADRASIRASIDGLVASGTTAGHIGAAWAWYTVSPNWNAVFTGAAVPAAYDATKTVKAVVLLSDFDMNSYYESGNGSSAAQTQALCTAMKAAGVVIYTLGYGVNASDSTAMNLWTNCATSAATRFNANNAAGLVAAFAGIANSTRNSVFSNGAPQLAE
ncbi:MAG: VWA domain-containing protein [Rhodospirillales bacterium]|nr:MAG: VWA domain-containing protein [Rhodospirillales bacterium]